MESTSFDSWRTQMISTLENAGMTNASLLSNVELSQLAQYIQAQVNQEGDHESAESSNLSSTDEDTAFIDDQKPTTNTLQLRSINEGSVITETDNSFTNAKFGRNVQIDRKVFNNIGRTDGTLYVIEDDNAFQNAEFNDDSTVTSNSYNGCINFNPDPSTYMDPHFESWGMESWTGSDTYVMSSMTVTVETVEVKDVLKNGIKSLRLSLKKNSKK
ncbi:hypothetical protein CPB83DRAFT_945574 [Crepidotus variabilis]|uniref:Uncharacterized protein n=1 Tax=Crepidotus variabilis TaxID=179855 RepID=A0A9P6EPT6_9AGAR|nr:hypothetical protein CPB83DRAFT_945574 [Crepidotus variabilis]